MGAPGPPGGFDKYLRTGVGYPPQAQSAQQQQQQQHPVSSGAFYTGPTSSPYPPTTFPPTTGGAGHKSFSFPPLSGPANPFNVSVPHGGSSALAPFFSAREHGPPTSAYPPGPPSSAQQPEFSQSSVLSSHNPPTGASAPPPSLTKDRGQVAVASSPLDGARLMALLTTQSAGETLASEDEGLSVVGQSPTPNLPELGPQGNSVPVKPSKPNSAPNSMNSVPVVNKFQDNKPRGRIVKGDRVSYDVDVRKPDEAQPQLEVITITVVGSDPEPIVGKQIAVNRDYICYGLRGCAIRIINRNTADSRALLRGHTKRVTDMAFPAEDVNCLASSSMDGRVIVRNILEGRAADGKLLIREDNVVALQFVGDWEATHPRICWHKHKQGFLVVAVEKYILLIDHNKVQQGAPQGGFLQEKPMVCHMNELPEGITIVGEHDEDVTDLSVPFYIAGHIASASLDGMVRVWGEKKSSSLSVFTPHAGEFVGAVAFLSEPDRSDNSVLLTAGNKGNRELKLWAPEDSSKSGGMIWQCIQTIEFQSSATGIDVDDAFFNQVVVAPRSSLIVVANAKKLAIYVLHVQFGSRPEKAQINYLAEFSVTIPILSLTVTEASFSEGGQGAVHIYCVQTQAIQQYTLLVSRCLPPPTEKTVKQPSRVADKPAVKVTVTPSSTPITPVEKPQENKPVADTIAVPSLVSNVPPRYERLTAAFENLLEGGQPITEMAKLIATTKLSPAELMKSLTDDSPRPIVLSSQVTQTVTEKSTQVSSYPVNKTVTKFDAPKTADPEELPVPPLKILSRSKSPPKVVDQGSVPVSTGIAKKQVGKPEDTRQGTERLARQSSGSMEDVSDSNPDVPVTTDLGRQASGSFEEAIEKMQIVNITSTLRRQQSGKREDLNSELGRAQEATMALDATSPFSSTNSAVDNFLEDEEHHAPFAASSTTVQGHAHTQPGVPPPHLITPSELMTLAGRAKEPEEENTRPHLAEVVIRDGDSPKALPMRVRTEIETVQLESVNFPIGAASASEIVSEQSEAGDRMNVSGFESSQLDSDSNFDGRHSVQGYTDYSQYDFKMNNDEGPLDMNVDDVQKQVREKGANVGEIGGESVGMSSQGSTVAKVRKNKNKTSGGGVGAAVPATINLPVTATLNPAILAEGEASSSWSFVDTGLVAQIATMQESLNQLVNMQSELQKQMTVMVSVPVTKEGKRLEAAMGTRMEKVLRAHVDAMWARLAEENAKREKMERERLEKINTLLGNFVNRDMPAVLERGLKKEFLALIPAVSQAILPPLQKAIASIIYETFQKGIAEKLIPQLERLILGKLEATISRQLQTQFQSVGKQALQDAIRTSFDGYIIPTFENSCQNLFEDMDALFKENLANHALNAQQQFSAMQAPLAATLQDTVASASALAESLKEDLYESNRRLAELVDSTSRAAGHGSDHHEASGFLEKFLPLQHVEDPKVKLAQLLKESRLEEAFHMALSLGDVAVVSWLCNQLDPSVVFQVSPPPLSQGVLLSLVQQLGVDIGTDTRGKLKWIQEAVLSLNPEDPGLVNHIRSVLEQVHSNLQQQTAIAGPGELSNQMRLVIHVVNSMLTACK